MAIADDIAGNGGLLFSHDDFVASVLPVYREIARAVKNQGLYAFFHSDGDTTKIMEALIDGGYDCIHPVDQQAGMEIATLRRTVGGKVSFMGHIDAVAWDGERVAREVARAQEQMGGGGLILGTSGGISEGTLTTGLAALYPRIGLPLSGRG
jgi:uroporphyrinogen decarboxylase